MPFHRLDADPSARRMRARASARGHGKWRQLCELVFGETVERGAPNGTGETFVRSRTRMVFANTASSLFPFSASASNAGTPANEFVVDERRIVGRAGIYRRRFRAMSSANRPDADRWSPANKCRPSRTC